MVSHNVFTFFHSFPQDEPLPSTPPPLPPGSSSTTSARPAGRQGGGDRTPVNLYSWKSVPTGTSVSSSYFLTAGSGIRCPETFADKNGWGYVTLMPMDIIDELVKQINDYALPKVYRRGPGNGLLEGL